jgi:hypothetical protein
LIRMANRFPLILDTTDGNKIKEIPSGDNLDLRNVSIVDAQNIDALGTINAAGIKINGADIQPGEFTDLDDTPNTLIGSEGLFVRVKADGTGLEFYELGGAEAELNITNLQVSQSILPDVDVGATIGNPTSRFDGIYGNFFQGSVKDNTGSTVFDAATGKIPYAAIVGAPNLISDLENDEGYIKATELRAVIPTFIEDGLVEVEVTNTGDLVGSVIGEDSTVLVDSLTSRINAARLTQNGANNGQTLVWDEATQVWVPGIAGDITGFASNKVDLLTVETGYSITYQDATGIIAADTIQLDTTVSTEVNNVKIRSNSNVYPDVDNTGSVGINGNAFANGYINNLVATTIAGDLTGNAVGETHKANAGVFGDNTGVAGSYKLHVIGDLGVTTGNLDLNGGSIISANFEDATGNFRGSFFGDDSTIIVDGTDNSITGNLKFPGATGTIEGTIIELTASNRIEVTDIQTTGDFFPRFNESGAIGTVARKFDEGNFVTLRADAFSIDTITASTINTENFVLSGTGTGTLSSNTDLVLESGNRTKVTGGTFKFPTLTQTEIDDVVVENGDTSYNTTTNKFEFIENSATIQLHVGTFTGIHKGDVQGLDGTQIFNGSTNKITTPTVIGTATFEEDVIVTGDLTVSGTTTTVNTEEVNIADNIILLNSNFTGPTPTESGGIEIERGDEDNKQFVWDEGTDKWSIGAETFNAATVEATTVTGDDTGTISGYLNITGATGGDITQFANITGDTGGTISGFTTLTGDTGGNISGFLNITGDSGGTISGFTSITGDTGGTVSGFLNITGDTGGTVSGFDAITGDGTGDITQFVNVTGTTSGDLTGFVNVTGTTAGSITDFLNVTGTGTGNISQFLDITGAGSGTVSNFSFQGSLLNSTGDTIVDFSTDQFTGTFAGDLVGNATGDHNGTLTGNVTGDIVGSVFSDGSTTLVDAVAGKIVGDYENGTSVIDNNSIESTTITAGKFVGPISRIVGDVQQISGPGAISLDTLVTEITTTATDDAYTLADGVLGQVKIIAMVIDAGDAIVTPTTLATGTTITFSDVNDNITLLYTTNGWLNTANQNATIA